MWKKIKSLLDFRLKRKLVLSLFLSSAEVLPVLAVTFCIQRALNRAVPQSDLQGLFLYGSGVLAATALITVLSLINSHISLQMNQKISNHLYGKIIEKCLRLTPFFYHQNRVASLNHTMMQDSEKFHTMGVTFLVKFFPSLIVSIAISLFLFFINPWLALILLSGLPVFVLLSKYLEAKLRQFSQASYQAGQKFSEGIRFLFDMMDLIQTQSAQRIESIRQKKNLDAMGSSLQKFFWHNSIYNLSQNFLLALVSIAILVVGGSMVIKKQMLWGNLIAFYIAIGMLKRYAQTMISAIPIMIEGSLSFSKLNAFLVEAEQSPYQGTKKHPFRGSVFLENVAFGFSSKPLFQNVNLSIEEGEIAALLGPNGAGKSTVVNLILGFYRPTQGKIYFDGVPLDAIDVVDLRSSISVVRQNGLIFPGTIGENILYGTPWVTRKELEEAAEIAELTQFIQDLPLKFDTPTGMSGLHLSGGQRQKIALARAIIRKPKLLILDEPTNHLDTASIKSICEHLLLLKQKMSILLISHHRDLASLADRSYLFEEGSLQPEFATL